MWDSGSIHGEISYLFWKLSILFVRFANNPGFRLPRLNSYFQFSLWDSRREAIEFILRLFTFNSLCEIPIDRVLLDQPLSIREAFNSLCEILKNMDEMIKALMVAFNSLCEIRSMIEKAFKYGEITLSILFVRFPAMAAPMSRSISISFNSLCEIR